jgi:hypothetical protein
MISRLWTDCRLISLQPTMTGPDKFTKMTLCDIRVYLPAKIAQYYCREIAKAAITRFNRFFGVLRALRASN